MKKILFILLILILAGNVVLADESTMLNLTTPTQLDEKNIGFSIRHRFYGDISDEPLDHFLGTDAGANVKLALRYQIIQNLEIKTAIITGKTEKIVGLSYKYERENFPIETQLDVEYFRYKEPILEEEDRHNFLYLLSAQNKPMWDERFLGMVNLGYDGYNERLVLGLGAMVRLKEDLWIFDAFHVLAEYYPVLDRDSAEDELEKYIGEEDAYGVGFRFDTYGHEFILMLSNTSAINTRRASLGVEEDSYLRFGFNIERKIAW
jgi:hypothetical protein